MFFYSFEKKFLTAPREELHYKTKRCHRKIQKLKIIFEIYRTHRVKKQGLVITNLNLKERERERGERKKGDINTNLPSQIQKSAEFPQFLQ